MMLVLLAGILGCALATPSAQWFTQTLDHFNAQDRRTWKQRFFVNATFYQAGGPIFFQVGGEGPISAEEVDSLQMSVYAQTFGALQITLEHRFYGESKPFPTLETPNLAYLTIEQALADAANFVSHIKTQYPNATKAVAFGGSYPGNLAAWLRIKYPTVFSFSVATSAPVRAVLDMVTYLEVVDQSIKTISGQRCDTLIKQATTHMENMLQTSVGAAKLSKMFNTCEKLEPLSAGNWLQSAMFSSNLMGNFMGTVQYEKRRGHHIGIPTVSELCKIMDTPNTTPLANYAAVNDLFMKRGQQSCMDISYKNYVAALNNMTDFGGGRSWTYQTCAQEGFFQSTDAKSQPFGTLVPLKFYEQICSDAFGMSMPPTVNFTNIYTGSDHPVGASRVMFVNCQYDPWKSLSVTKTLSPSLKALVVQDGAHCCTMDPYEAGKMSPHIYAAQVKIASQIDTWLKASPLLDE